MTNKQITDLTSITTLTDDDLFLVRDTTTGIDKKIAKAALVGTLGNSAINGFSASYADVNKVILTATSGSAVTSYVTGMTISFVVPNDEFDPEAVFQVKINALAYKTIVNYGTNQSIVVAPGEFIEAVYGADGYFHRTNDSNDTNSSIEYIVSGTANAIVLTTINGVPKGNYYNGMAISFVATANSNAAVTIAVDALAAKSLVNQVGQNVTNLISGQPIFAIYNGAAGKFVTNIAVNNIITNEYIVAETEILTGPNRTIFHLESAIGLPKEQVFGNYYPGMMINFVGKFDDDVRIKSSGTVYVTVDGLGQKLLRDPDGDQIQNDVLLDQTILGIYNGTDFIKNRFAVEADEGIVDVPDLPPEPAVIDPFDPSYAGDLRDPANATNENSVDDNNNKIFSKVFTVGSSLANFRTLKEAIEGLVREFGNSGQNLRGQKVALLIQSNYAASTYTDNYITGGDLRFITIFGQGNATITINNALYIKANFSPIFNLKITRGSSTVSDNSMFRMEGVTHLTLGKNTQLTMTSSLSNVACVFYNNVGITAKYGLIITSRYPLFYTYCAFSPNVNSTVYFNKLSYIFTGALSDIAAPNNGTLIPIKYKTSCTFVNTTITITNKQDNANFGVFSIDATNYPGGEHSFINCTSTDRSGKMFGLKTINTNINIVNSNFSAGGTGSGSSGYDIQVLGTTRLNTITVDAATAAFNPKYNQALNVETNLGRILLGA